MRGSVICAAGSKPATGDIARQANSIAGPRHRAESAGPVVKATSPNQKWAVDFTYVWTGKRWLFVALVLDLYWRRVVSWSMQPTMTA